MSDKPTKPTWPEAAMPTPAEWADWFVSQNPEARVTIAEKVLDQSSQAAACFLRNHASLENEVRWLRQRNHRLRTAWISARRRGRVLWAVRDHLRGDTPDPTPNTTASGVADVTTGGK